MISCYAYTILLLPYYYLKVKESSPGCNEDNVGKRCCREGSEWTFWQCFRAASTWACWLNGFLFKNTGFSYKPMSCSAGPPPTLTPTLHVGRELKALIAEMSRAYNSGFMTYSNVETRATQAFSSWCIDAPGSSLCYALAPVSFSSNLIFLRQRHQIKQQYMCKRIKGLPVHMLWYLWAWA